MDESGFYRLPGREPQSNNGDEPVSREDAIRMLIGFAVIIAFTIFLALLFPQQMAALG